MAPPPALPVAQGDGDDPRCRCGRELSCDLCDDARCLCGEHLVCPECSALGCDTCRDRAADELTAPGRVRLELDVHVAGYLADELDGIDGSRDLRELARDLRTALLEWAVTR